MKISEVYRKHFKNQLFWHNDLSLISFSDKLMVGVDKDGYSVIVLISDKNEKFSLNQKTKMLSMECNVRVNYTINNVKKESNVHLIRCLSKEWKEREIFIELSLVFLDSINEKNEEESIMEVFSTLVLFFSMKSELTDKELRGIYTELYTIWSYKDIIDLSLFWQSRERMKFDFSLSEDFKVEIKSTIKDERRHHFRHEQLSGSYKKIYIVSYMLRNDDIGLSMYDLLLRCKSLFWKEPKKLMRLELILKNSSEDRLKNMKFNESYLIKKRKIYMSDDIPKFQEESPTGVTNAEYDCILENVVNIDENMFLNACKKEIEAV